MIEYFHCMQILYSRSNPEITGLNDHRFWIEALPENTPQRNDYYYYYQGLQGTISTAAQAITNRKECGTISILHSVGCDHNSNICADIILKGLGLKGSASPDLCCIYSICMRCKQTIELHGCGMLLLLLLLLLVWGSQKGKSGICGMQLNELIELELAEILVIWKSESEI